MIMTEINAKIMQIQLHYLIYNLVQFKKDELVQQSLKVANDLLNVNNISACVQVLNVRKKIYEKNIELFFI